MRELAIFLLLSGANKFIVAHNHPNGSKNVSVNDINITRKIQEMANFIVR
jgi:DNA repair protein RadC